MKATLEKRTPVKAAEAFQSDSGFFFRLDGVWFWVGLNGKVQKAYSSLLDATGREPLPVGTKIVLEVEI